MWKSRREYASLDSHFSSSYTSSTFQWGATQIYDQTIKPLPVSDRLKLAKLILNGIPPQSVVDYGDEWSDEDYRDFNKSNWEHIDKRLVRR